MMLGKVCTWCLAQLTVPSSTLRIHFTYDDLDRDEITRWQSDQNSGSLLRKAELMAEAIDRGWQIEINGWRDAGVPVATWHGDPVCQPHLWELAERERQPQTVRMAQWDKARGRSGY